MAPRIGYSIGQGFRVANRSWAGMGFFAGVWILLFGLVILDALIMNPPPELFQERTTEERAVSAPETAAPKPAVTPAGESATSGSPTTSSETKAETKEPDLFQQLATGDSAGAPAQTAAAPAPATPAAQGTSESPSAARDRIVDEWFKRNWPLLLVSFIVFMAAGTWISGGQIGYLAKRLTTGSARVSECWISGTRAFWALLGGSALAWLMAAGAFLLTLLASVVFAALSKALPNWLLIVLGVILGVAVFLALLWLMVRLSFWFIAIVADRLGPIAGLKAGFRATRGYWWKLCGLLALVLLISYAVWLPFRFLVWIGGLVGGAAAPIFAVLGTALGAIANLYAGFAMTGAFIRFYEDAKSAPVSTSPSTP